MTSRRALHFVFKVGDRTKTAEFYRDVLGMQFLRHEEFEEGCKATCNGPYDGKWSKSMVGFGPEDSHFVTELTYNYGIKDYKLGNDFQGITIQSNKAVQNARSKNWPLVPVSDGLYSVEAPGGYKFYLVDQAPPQGDPVQKVTLGVSNLTKSTDYWTKLCGMTLYEQTDKSVLLGYGDGQCKLELKDVGGTIDRGTAYGRVAFSCPRDQVRELVCWFKTEHFFGLILHPIRMKSFSNICSDRFFFLSCIVPLCGRSYAPHLHFGPFFAEWKEIDVKYSNDGLSVWSKGHNFVSFALGRHSIARDSITYVMFQTTLDDIDWSNNNRKVLRVGFQLAIFVFQLAGIESSMRESGQAILTPLVSLDTPGKATVEVVILADPDAHEICFVGDEAFRELSQVDPKADALLDEVSTPSGAEKGGCTLEF